MAGLSLPMKPKPAFQNKYKMMKKSVALKVPKPTVRKEVDPVWLNPKSAAWKHYDEQGNLIKLNK